MSFTKQIQLKQSIDNSYRIIIGKGARNLLVRTLKHLSFHSNYAIITDFRVNKLFGEELLEKLRQNNIKAKLLVFEGGEKNKNVQTIANLQEQMFAAGFGRDSTIIALGGGLVGDVAGFVAATFARGIPYIQVPTTLLAMADSSIGGKTGVNLKHGKNLIGAFHHPKKVYIDTDFLNTLPDAELSNGLAEIIKTAIVSDKNFFRYLEQNISKVFSRDEKVLAEIINKSCGIKAAVVEKDEKEIGFRKILNFGHTIGHALEKVTNYELSHGKAVALGMLAEANISNVKESDISRIKDLLKAANLPVTIHSKTAIRDIIPATKSDKKARQGKVRYTLLERIGKTKLNRECSFEIPDETVKISLEQLRK